MYFIRREIVYIAYDHGLFSFDFLSFCVFFCWFVAHNTVPAGTSKCDRDSVVLCQRDVFSTTSTDNLDRTGARDDIPRGGVVVAIGAFDWWLYTRAIIPINRV